jgi:hypothetical protein
MLHKIPLTLLLTAVDVAISGPDRLRVEGDTYDALLLDVKVLGVRIERHCC